MIRFDGADLQAVSKPSQQKFQSGGLTIGTESPSSPNKESGCPGQLVGGKGFGKRRRGGTLVHRIRGSSGRRDMSLPPEQHKHPVTGLPPIACLTSEDI